MKPIVVGQVLLMVSSLTGCVSIKMGEDVSRGEPMVQRVEEIAGIKDIILEPRIGLDGSLQVTLKAVTHYSILDKSSVIETKTENRANVGIMPGLPFAAEYDIGKSSHGSGNYALAVLVTPFANLIALGLPTFATCVYEPFFQEYGSHPGCYNLWKNIFSYGLMGVYKYRTDPVSKQVPLPLLTAAVQKNIPRRLLLSCIDVECTLSEPVSFKDRAQTDEQGTVKFLVKTDADLYLDMELRIRDVSRHQYAKLLEPFVNLSHKYRIQLSRRGSILLPARSWGLKNVVILSQDFKKDDTSKMAQLLNGIGYFNVKDRANIEIAMQEQLVDRARIFSSPDILQSVCRSANCEWLVVVKAEGSGMAAKLVEVATGITISTANASGPDAAAIIAETLCKEYAFKKQQTGQ